MAKSGCQAFVFFVLVEKQTQSTAFQNHAEIKKQQQEQGICVAHKDF